MRHLGLKIMPHPEVIDVQNVRHYKNVTNVFPDLFFKNSKCVFTTSLYHFVYYNIQNFSNTPDSPEIISYLKIIQCPSYFWSNYVAYANFRQSQRWKKETSVIVHFLKTVLWQLVLSFQPLDQVILTRITSHNTRRSLDFEH